MIALQLQVDGLSSTVDQQARMAKVVRQRFSDAQSTWATKILSLPTINRELDKKVSTSSPTSTSSRRLPWRRSAALTLRWRRGRRQQRQEMSHASCSVYVNDFDPASAGLSMVMVETFGRVETAVATLPRPSR